MSAYSKGYNRITTIIHDWTEEDRQDAIDFALHPGNGVTSVCIYLKSKGCNVSISTVSKWIISLADQSEKVKRMRIAFNT